MRKGNEDAYLVDDSRGVYAVIDGMGGLGNGDRASAIALDELRRGLDLRAALRRAGERIQAESGGNAGMGCVATAIRVEGRRVQVAHLGDTRAFLVSDAGNERLTRDHTVAAAVQERDGLSDGDVRSMEGRNVVTRDLGGVDLLDPDWPDELDAELGEGDLLVLTTDGVHGVLPAEEMNAFLRTARRERRTPQSIAGDLIERAYASGSNDNATAVVVALYAPASALSPIDPGTDRSTSTRPGMRRASGTSARRGAAEAPRGRRLLGLLLVAITGAFVLGVLVGRATRDGAEGGAEEASPASTPTEGAPTESAATESAPTESAPTEDGPTETAPTEATPAAAVVTPP